MSGLRSGTGGYASVGVGGAPGRKLKKAQAGDCLRCGKTFKTYRDVPYCTPCFKEKRTAA